MTRCGVAGAPGLEGETSFSTSPAGGLAITFRAAAAVSSLPLPPPPRVGLYFCLPSRLGRDVSWFGRGPWESYPDRLASAQVGLFGGLAAEDLHVPYLYPSENGGRADVRWVALRDGALGDGLLIACTPRTEEAVATMQLNVSRYSPAALAAAAHDHELRDSGFVHVHCDAAHFGLGGDDSWTRSVHKDFVPGSRSWAPLEVELLPLSAGDCAADVYRRLAAQYVRLDILG